VKGVFAIVLLAGAVVAAAMLSTGPAAAQSSRDRHAAERCSNSTLRGTFAWDNGDGSSKASVSSWEAESSGDMSCTLP
jgi:hypothetical protein